MKLALTSILAALLLGGCGFFRSAEVPMPVEAHQPNGPGAARGLVVFLPGFGDGPEDFEERGFVERVRGLPGPWDVVATDAHFGYYRGFTVVERLHEDVIAPAKARGYREIWLVGISMGGMGAFSYAMEHPDLVTGVIGLAPYLGDSDVIEEVSDAGGLEAWQPKPPEAYDEGEERYTRNLWAFFKSYAGVAAGPRPALYLGWGDDDSLAEVGGMVAKVLPADHVVSRDGGHKWYVWQPLFEVLAPRALEATAAVSRAR